MQILKISGHKELSARGDFNDGQNPKETKSKKGKGGCKNSNLCDRAWNGGAGKAGHDATRCNKQTQSTGAHRLKYT